MKLFPDPEPRKRERPYTPFNFPMFQLRRLPKSTGNSLTFTEVLRRRKSTRQFPVPVSDANLGTLLETVCRVEGSCREKQGFRWQHRAVPSAGGRHPIHVLVVQRRGPILRTWLYTPEDHVLMELNVLADAVRGLVKAAGELLPIGKATLIWLAAEIARTDSKYANPETLIWRDAGALLGYMNLVASAYCLPFCALGVSGEPYISRMLRSGGQVIGVGGMVVGGD